MRTYNITKNLNTNAGRNKYSIPIGTTRNIRGSANRIFQYCKQNSDDPFYCMFGIGKPSPPIKPCLNGFVSYSYTYTGSGQISEAVVKQNLPVYSIADVLNVNPEITIIGNTVYVEIITCLYDLPSYPDDVGISLNSNPDIVNFINTNTNGITFTASSNCPFAKNGSQFKGVNNLTITQAKGFREITYFTPYFLPGTSLSGCFQDCTNFNSNISGWDTTNVVDMKSMFLGATSFNIDIGGWNTSNVTDMAGMFTGATSFNQPIGNWNTSNVINIAAMFSNATSFNQPIGNWNISKVISMSTMFFKASSFNQSLENWDTSNVTNMAFTFREATNFNQNINSWNTSNVTTMLDTFRQATNFNQPLNSWDTSKVTTMSNMFRIATSFNQPLNNWNTSNVTDMSNMFQSATLFNQDLNNWNTSNVTTMASMFYLATSFNQPLNNWNTSNVTDMSNMFRQTNVFNQNIGSWDISKVTTMANMFYISPTFNNGGNPDIQNWSAPLCTSFKYMFSGATLFNQPLTNLYKNSTANSCDMSLMFYLATSFNQNVGEWNVSKVTTMANMFQQATAFNNGGSSDIQTWNSPLCTNFGLMFYLATSFNQPLTNLVDTSGLSDGCSMNQMFRSATIFNQNIGSWDVSKVTNMSQMFQEATAFNNGGSSDIQNWTAPLCTSFSSMFNLASNFNQPLPILVNTSGIASCSLQSMFNRASSFNRNIGSWNTINVNDMLGIFNQATAFNNGGSPDIQNWTAPLCTSFSSMFNSASNFNQPLPILVNTSGVASCSLQSMFQLAINFNQNLNSWNTSNVTTMSSMFSGSSSSGTNMKFNNGETGLQSIPNITPSSAIYKNNTGILTCPGATFTTNLASGDCLIIQTSTIVYSTFVQSISTDTTLVVSSSYRYGSDINSGIISIDKQVSGTSPLTFNTSNVTNLNSMFQYCRFFNQSLTTSGSTWNTNKVNTLTNCFGGTSTSGITVFNNGQLITGSTAPMEWTFIISPTSSAYRTNCRLTTSNKPASLP